MAPHVSTGDSIVLDWRTSRGFLLDILTAESLTNGVASSWDLISFSAGFCDDISSEYLSSLRPSHDPLTEGLHIKYMKIINSNRLMSFGNEDLLKWLSETHYWDMFKTGSGTGVLYTSCLHLNHIGLCILPLTTDEIIALKSVVHEL